MLIPVGLFRLSEMLPKGFILLAALLWGVAIQLMKWAMKQMRERVTFPRAGYVVARRPSKATRDAVRIATFVFVFLLTAIGIAFPLTAVGEQWGWLACTAFGMFFAACLAHAGLKARRPHMLMVALVPLLTVAWISRNRFGFKESSFWLLLWQGGALVFSGALRLLSFLKANPKIENTGA